MKPLLLLSLKLAMLAGCGSAPPDAPGADLLPPTYQGKPMTLVSGAPNAAKPSAEQYALVVRLRLATVEVPVGTASGSEEIWSYLNEEPIKAARSATLGRNGFRMGLAAGDAWPDISRILARMTGRPIQQSTKLALPGVPTAVVLKQDQPAQTIFVFHEDRTLSGSDYPEGDNLLGLVCTLDSDDPSRVMITGVPQVRSKRHVPDIVNDGAGPMIVSRPRVFALEGMTFRVVMSSKDILVVGPGAESARPGSAGNRFLVKMKEGVEFETMLVIVPEVFAAPVRVDKPHAGAEQIEE